MPLTNSGGAKLKEPEGRRPRQGALSVFEQGGRGFSFAVCSLAWSLPTGGAQTPSGGGNLVLYQGSPFGYAYRLNKFKR